MKVQFLKVTDNAAKLRRIGAITEAHYIKGEKVMIATPNQAASEYLDDFLWKQPKEGFLPHTCTVDTTSDPIVISSEHENLNQAQVLINLCSKISPIADQFEQIYELLDETDPLKKEMSEKKMQDYRNEGNELDVI